MLKAISGGRNPILTSMSIAGDFLNPMNKTGQPSVMCGDIFQGIKRALSGDHLDLANYSIS